ncbi:MAG: nucleotide sugar dehydrogenase [Bacteroidales bacterium]|nr:nucleotide sugar dehydrogenase [Bacteroidales bacterium]
MSVFQNLINKNSKIAVIGQGYVGIPLAIEFAKKLPVIGFEINKEKLETLRQGKDPNQEIYDSEFKNLDIEFTDDERKLDEAVFFIVAVPTPIDKHNHPDLSLLKSASETIARHLKKGDYVVYESTVYPGATEDDCVPILERISNLKYKEDFKVGYSPERINPGDKVHTLTNTIKIVSGCDEESLHEISRVYKLVIEADLHLAETIKTAEAAKIIENTQRDVNIGLMNELSIIFGRLGINTYDVLKAAGTKWNFLNFHPGLVGGHCIGVDPYYLAYKAQELKYHPQIINSGRFVNDSMGSYIAKQVVKRMLNNGIKLPGARVIIFGVTFKENVADIRNSKTFDIVNELNEYGITIEITDPFANPDEIKNEYSIQLNKNPLINPRNYQFDAAIISVAHDEYRIYCEDDFKKILQPNALIADIKGIYRKKITGFNYWSL